MKEKSVEKQNIQNIYGENIYLHHLLQRNMHTVTLFSLYFHRKIIRPRFESRVRHCKTTAFATFHLHIQKAARKSAKNRSSWNRVTVTWFLIHHFFASIFTTRWQIALEIDVDSVSYHVSWVYKRKFWNWTSRCEHLQNLHGSCSIYMVLHWTELARPSCQFWVLISKVTIHHLLSSTSSLVHTWLDSRPLGRVWTFYVESSGVKCGSWYSLHSSTQDPTTITEGPLLTTSQTRAIADISLHSDCNHVIGHERKTVLRGWTSGGRWNFQSPWQSTSGHGTFDRVVHLQQRMAQKNRHEVWMEGW